MEYPKGTRRVGVYAARKVGSLPSTQEMNSFYIFCPVRSHSKLANTKKVI